MGVITHPYPNFNGGLLKLGSGRVIISQKTINVITYPYLNFNWFKFMLVKGIPALYRIMEQ